MNDNNVEEEIRKHLQMEVEHAEPGAEWWNRLFSNIGKQQPLSFWSLFVPKTRLAWALIPLVVLLIGGTVYGATTGVIKLFEGWAGDVEKQGLSTSLNLSQTIDGITVTLERAYADSNVVLIGYTVNNESDNPKLAFGGNLSTTDGQKLDTMMGLVGMPEAERLGMDNRATIFAYDASKITGTPIELSLTLKVGSIVFSGITDETTQVPWPFIFNFRLPFHAGIVIDVHQIIDAAGIPVALEQVVISPWATRADFNFYSPGDGPSTVSLKLPSGQSKDMGIGKGVGTSLYSCYFDGDFTGESGEWTLKINDLGSPPTQFGPWVFHFQVP